MKKFTKFILAPLISFAVFSTALGASVTPANIFNKSGDKAVAIPGITQICKSDKTTCTTLGAGGVGAVTSVFSRTGAVVATDGDYNQSKITGLKTTDSPTFAGINLNGTLTGTTVVANTFNGVALTTAGSGTGYLANDGNYKAVAGGTSWGSTIAGTSGTGLTTTISDSASAGTIGQSIVIGNTQTNAIKALDISTGTSNVANYAINVDSDTATNSGLFTLRNFNTATQRTTNQKIHTISLGRNWNTNSAVGSVLLRLQNEDNASTGRNGGILVYNYYTAGSPSNDEEAGIKVQQVGADGSAIVVYGNNNVNSSTNGLVNYTLSNTQSAGTVMQKIDTGTSAQVHTGLLVNLVNASNGATGVQVNLGSTGTGVGYDVVSSSLAGIGLYQGTVTANGNLTSDTRNKVTYLTTRTHTATTTISDNYNVVFAKKTSRVNNASATYNATGAVFYAGNVVTNFAGTINDSSIVLELVQDIDSTGNIASFKTGETEYVGVSVKGNLLINTPTQNGNLVGGIVMKNGTVASASVTDGIQIYSADTSDSTATLALYTEQAVEEIGTFTESHKLKVIINGTAYWITLDAV
jgi:hypothetical protein